MNMIWDTHFVSAMLCFPVFLVGATSLCYSTIFYTVWPPTMQKIKKQNERKTEEYSTPVAAACVCYNAKRCAGGSWRLVMAVWGVEQSIRAECEWFMLAIMLPQEGRSALLTCRLWACCCTCCPRPTLRGTALSTAWISAPFSRHS